MFVVRCLIWLFAVSCVLCVVCWLLSCLVCRWVFLVACGLVFKACRLLLGVICSCVLFVDLLSVVLCLLPALSW